MANIKSAKKRILVNQAKTEQNKRLKTKLAVKKIDQACAKGILKKNTASRKKSKLVLHLNRANA